MQVRNKFGFKRIFCLFATALFGGVSAASAASSPLLLVAPSDGFSNNGSLTVTTNAMPKGWFADSTFDRTKSEIRLDVEISASDCSEPVVLNYSSKTDGTFTATMNSRGNQVTGWIWSIPLDLSAYRDHWHNLIHCDESVEAVGCKEPRVVGVSATAYDRQGACHTYTNDAGQTVCASDSKSGLLNSIQDADQHEEGCVEVVVTCDIGACVSSCQEDCNAGKCAPGDEGAACREAKTACNQCCECECKAETSGCTPQDLCYSGSSGHPACLAE